MSQQNVLFNLTTLKASAALATAVAADLAAGTETCLYIIVSLDASGDVIKCPAAANEAVHPLGVLQNKPTHTGDACEIAYLGTTKVLMAETCDEAEIIVPADDASGYGEVADANGEFGIGIALEAATAANDIIEVMLCPGINAEASEAD